MEDLDTPRVVTGAADQILHSLERYGLQWDGEVIRQSNRAEAYADALEKLREGGRAYDCACSRSDIARSASAPLPARYTQTYPGTCRKGLPSGRTARAVRFAVPDNARPVQFVDLVCGTQVDDVAHSTGDFVVRRADGLFAYQLAVVVDDAAQGITQVVRGADLLSSTGRQILLQQALGFEQPEYAHLPLIVDGGGAKLGKRDGALPLPLLDERALSRTLHMALSILGIRTDEDLPRPMLLQALERFEPGRIPAREITLDSVGLTEGEPNRPNR